MSHLWPRFRARGSWFRLLTAGFVLVSSRAVAGAWAEPAGEGLIIADVTLDEGDRYIDAAGHVHAARRYRDLASAGYLAYGLTDRLTLVVNPSADARRIGNPDGGTYAGPGTSAIGAQYEFLRSGPTVVSFAGTFRLPGSWASRDPALVGNTARELDLRLLGGISPRIGPFPVFVEIQSGYRLRSGGAAAIVILEAAAGLRVTPALQIVAQCFNQLPTGPGPPALPSATFSKVEISAVYDVTPTWALQAGGFVTVAGRNALIERGLVVAVWHRF